MGQANQLNTESFTELVHFLAFSIRPEVLYYSQNHPPVSHKEMSKVTVFVSKHVAKNQETI